VGIGASANLEVVDKFCYLGDMLSVDGDAAAAVEARIRIGWNKFRQLVRLLTNRDISFIRRGMLYSRCVRSSMLHESETWPVRKDKRPASPDRTARRQFQATGQPVSRTQAGDAMTSRLPRYEAKYVQRRCFQWGSVPLRSDIKGTELPPANILIPLERQLIALQFCRGEFLPRELC